MSFMLTHHSAVRWYRAATPAQLAPERACFVTEGKLEASRTRLQGLDHTHLAPLGRPLHLLVPWDTNRRRSSEVVNHRYFGPTIYIPARHLSQGLFVTSPELTYLVEARTMTFPELLFLGYELTSQYRFVQAEDGRTALAERPPICTAASLSEFVAGHTHVRGRRVALRALACVAEGARSPMEACLSSMLSADVAEGGFGLPTPALNAFLPVPSELRALSDVSYYVPDLLYTGGNLVVEYDSDQFHTASEQISANSVRRNALESMGYRVVAVTRRQIGSFTEMCRIARIIACHLGLPAVEPGEPQRVLHRQMLRFALDADALFRETSAEAAHHRNKRTWHSHMHENNPTLR